MRVRHKQKPRIVRSERMMSDSWTVDGQRETVQWAQLACATVFPGMSDGAQ